MTHMAWSKEWQASVRRTSALLTTALLALLLTACMVVLAYRSAANVALLAAQGTAVAGALLQVGIVGRLSVLVLRASRAWWRLRAGGKRTEQAKQLRGAIAQAIVVTGLMSMSALAAAALAGSLPVFMQVPELGLSFLILIAMLLVQRMHVRTSCRRLTDALAAAEHAARRTMVA
ncbi:hypothetical protein FHR56_001797 [Xanthomonas sacchari]|uniref:hypothetical protein n=1 Tax=unclassified Xanthomonas TaxID=2643310 RepID=UPI00136ED139|nr:MULTISPECIES: hypothetical protein [unclassified Xanthomonas]MBB6366684.1 hypothetical protein [Xanthomonas sp. F10]MXV34065.1 hypothetical protein [Xanthomonas sp. LMG 8989]